MVVTILFRDAIGLLPVFMSIKQPVPYVVLTSPRLKHPCPKRAACWSPMHDAMGTSNPHTFLSVVPYTQELSFTSGRMQCGMSSNFNKSSSHSSVCML